MAYRIEGLAADVVEEADVIVSAALPHPAPRVTLDDIAATRTDEVVASPTSIPLDAPVEPPP